MDFLATTICFITLNYQTISSELRQTTLSGHLRYLCVPFALQKVRMRDRLSSASKIAPHTSTRLKEGGCAIPVSNDYNNLVGEPGSTSPRSTLYVCGTRRKLLVISAHAPTETAEYNNKDAFYDEVNALTYKISRQQVVIDGMDANAKIRLEQQSDVWKMVLSNGAHVE